MRRRKGEYGERQRGGRIRVKGGEPIVLFLRFCPFPQHFSIGQNQFHPRKSKIVKMCHKSMDQARNRVSGGVSHGTHFADTLSNLC